MRLTLHAVAVALVAGMLAAGCQSKVTFPTQSMSEAAKAVGAAAAYDMNHDGRADYFLFADSAGRINRIGYSTDKQPRANEIVDLDSLPVRQCRHLVIILDGFGYDVIRKYYDEGHLRMFHMPSRVTAPYPGLTDLCLEDALGYIPCRGFEAMYYNWRDNEIEGGSLDYLMSKNEPYNSLLAYRADMIWDAIGYLYPWQVFGHEINAVKGKFDQTCCQEFMCYFVSSAGVSTRDGAQGQRMCLERVEQLVNQVLWETRGMVKFTMLADHGHSYTKAARIGLEPYLKQKGWNLVERLKNPRDVAYIRFGLETYASFAAEKPAELAQDLIAFEGVAIATYPDKDAAVVLGRNGQKAMIRKKNEKFSYEAVSGDPLKINAILAKLTADQEGYYEREALFQATHMHEYPDPMQRIWRAHFGMTQNAPNVIISLENRYYSGAQAFGNMVDIASTHGSLDYANSTTFIMSTAGPLPPAMPSSGIPQNMTNLIGGPWPMRK